MGNRDAPLKIGLKYCGGCSPDYERVELVRQMKQRLGDKAEFLPHDTPGISMGVAVQGCPTACGDLSSFAGLPVWIITSQADAEAFIRHMEATG
ncbi:MAG: hypothetical protein K9K62_00280 [Desulfobacteraceae bacterium]|nr:hypothetical protein [Desulfobacteraceae bacterium]